MLRAFVVLEDENISRDLIVSSRIVCAVVLIAALSGAVYYACTRKCDVREEPRPISPIPQVVSAAPRVKPSPLKPARLTDSALALAGEKQWCEVLSAARKIAENEREHYALAISALGVLGSLGDETDWARLNRLKPNLPQAMKKALSVAQDKLRARFQ